MADSSGSATRATAAGIPYEGTDCTADEAVEAVKAVRASAATEPHEFAKTWLDTCATCGQRGHDGRHACADEGWTVKWGA